MAEKSELMTDLLPEAFITCTSANPEYYVTIKTQTLKEAHRWHDAVLALSRRTPAEAGEVSEAIEREANFILDRLDDLVIDWDDDESYRQFSGHVVPSMERLRHLLAARRVQPKQDAPSPDVAGLIEAAGALVTAVRFADPPKFFNGVECHEARVPIEFIQNVESALSRLTPPKQDDARDSTVGAEPVAWRLLLSSSGKPGSIFDSAEQAAAVAEGFSGVIVQPLYTAASLTSARADGEWQPIETLPNSDDLVIAYCPPDPDFPEGRTMIWRASMLFDQFARIAKGIKQPAHLSYPATNWRPLPQPPAAIRALMINKETPVRPG